jgi:hypothetical protein
MDFLSRLITYISPEAGFKRMQYQQAIEVLEKKRNYDAGMINRFNNRWNAAWGSGELVDKPYRQRLLLIARDLEHGLSTLSRTIFIR